jgi:hypothetical protein
MKSIKGENKLVCYFETRLARYGKVVQSGRYKLELTLPLEKFVGYFPITIYFSKRKPKFHDLYVLGALWFPFYCLLYLCLPVIFIGYTLIQILCAFFYNYLHDSDDILLRISGYISLILSIIGIISIIKFLF